MASAATHGGGQEPAGRSVLITGASSGIGAFCARALRQEGWRVLVTARKPEDLQALRSEGFEAFYLDYRDPASIERLAADVLAATEGRLDALFNNGAYSQAGAVEDLPVAALREQFEANFFGWHDLTTRIVPLMRAQGHGRIVNCSSVLGFTPVKHRGAYASSKFALEGLTLCLRAELSGSGVHVSLIEPGPVKSKIAANGLPWFLKNIDHENSVHRRDYQAQLDRMERGGSGSKFKPGPEVVHAALRHALLSRRPKAHYLVTWQSRAAALLRRVLPAGLFYRVVASRG